MKTSLEHRITKMRIRTLSLTSLPATTQFSCQNLHYRPPWSPPSSNSMSKSSIFVLCKCLLIKLCGWVLLMGLWVDGVCGLMVFVSFVDAIVLLDLWFLLIPLFCWVCGFWLWSMVTGFLRFVGSMVRLFFSFSFFCLFSWESHCSSIFSSSSQNLRKERERLLGRAMKERRDVTDVTNRLRIRTEMVSF